MITNSNQYCIERQGTNEQGNKRRGGGKRGERKREKRRGEEGTIIISGWSTKNALSLQKQT